MGVAKPVVGNPEVTLDIEANLYPEDAKQTSFIAWDCVADVTGDDGRQYWIGIAQVGTRGAHDVWIMGISWIKGSVDQFPGTAYKIANFPPGLMSGWHIHPFGSLAPKKSRDKVEVVLGDSQITCNNDKTWNFSAEDKKQGIKLEMVHHGRGYPCWYGKEKPMAFTPNIIVSGYYWSGLIEGKLTLGDHKVNIKGAGVRERVYAVSACPAEGGGWHDWMWFHFDEMFGCMDEMKYSKFKLMSLYVVDEKKFTQAGSFNIEHFDWAYARPPMGVFIPTRYKATMETESGTLEISANVVGYRVSSYTGGVPDAPTTNLHFDGDSVTGTFTYKDGRKKKLANGRAGTVIRQWKPYPDFTPHLAAPDLPVKPLLPII